MNNNYQNIQWPGWETVDLIGRGSFGAVYEIRRNVLGNIEKAALKVISIPQNASDVEEMYNDGYDRESITSTFQAHLKSIVAEYALMRKMNGSSNIVNCDDVRYVQHDDGIGWDIFIKMELLTPLAKALPARISEDVVIELARDMCAALTLCQKHGIVHRDIKPQNIFLSDNGDYKLGDFGVAKTVEKTSGGTKIGTYKYMAPEVYNNQPYGVSADIYSLGLVLYWMLNERRMPFLPLPPEKLHAGMDESARNRRLAGEDFPPPAHGSAMLKRIVMKACAFDPAVRYHSAQEMLSDLDMLQDDPTVGLFAGRAAVVSKPPVSDFVSVENKPAEPVPPSAPEVPTGDPVRPAEEQQSRKGEKKKSKTGLIIGGILALIILLILLLLHSCGTGPGVRPGSNDETTTGATTATTNPQDEETYEMSLSQESMTLVVDTAVQLTAIGIPEDADIKWSSDNKNVAVVDENGLVTGVAEGEATITAQWKHNKETYQASAVVTVANSGIILNAYNLELTRIGQTETLTGTTYPEGQTITWASSDEKIATVSADGTVTAMGEGETVVSASFGGYTAECTVRVSLPSISFAQNDVSLYLGDSAKLNVDVTPGGTPVTWTSSNESVVKIQNGEITAVGAGSVTVTAQITCDGVSYQSTCKVTVTAPSISLSSTSLTLMPGKTANLSANTNPSDVQVSWSSDNTSVASVNGGTVTAVSPGTAKITAKITYNGESFTASCSVTVSTPSISLNYSNVTITVGDTTTLKASTKPEGAQVSWSSSNTSVATVKGGTVTAVSAGTAKITAKMSCNGKNYEASCTVTVSKPTISVTANSTSLTYSPRDKGTCTLTANVTPDGGTVSWRSSNTSVATVSGNGKTATVTAVSDGTVTVTATYQVGGVTVSDSCTITISRAGSTLAISNLWCPDGGTCDSFRIQGTVSSNYPLVRMECKGTCTSNALGISLNDTADPLYLPDGVFTYDLADATAYFINQYRKLYELYKNVAGLLGADNSVTMNVVGTVYDATGNSKSFNFVYIIYGE